MTDYSTYLIVDRPTEGSLKPQSLKEIGRRSRDFWMRLKSSSEALNSKTIPLFYNQQGMLEKQLNLFSIYTLLTDNTNISSYF